MNIYFRSTTLGVNYRVYARKNGILFHDPGFISITDSGHDQNNFIMGLVSLSQGDVIDFEVRIYGATETASSVTLHAGPGHTYILIESL